MSSARTTTLWARTFVDELVRHGVRSIALAPGSRSTPVVLAAASRAEIEMHVHLDERSAGFFALGVGKATGRPAAVLTTSGTAVANLLPAVVEASTSDTPLLVLTADRPPHNRGLDANQAIDQVRIFGAFARLSIDIPLPVEGAAGARHLRVAVARGIAAALGAPAGPAHLNLPFEKPLEPGSQGSAEDEDQGDVSRIGGLPFTAVERVRPVPAPAEVEAVAALCRGADSGIIVAGPGSCPGGEADASGAAARIIELASTLGWPVLADPLSGLRHAGSDTGSELLVGTYDTILRSPLARERLRPDVVLRLGGSPTSSRLCSFLEDHFEVPQVVVDPGARWKDHTGSAQRYLRAYPVDFADRLSAELDSAPEGATTRDWLAAEQAARVALRGEDSGAFYEGVVLREVAHALPEHASLFVSSSMPVRDLDAFVPPSVKRITVLGNRGASGIDGILSTALGVASASPGPTAAVVGDLAFLHDLNGLFVTRSETRGTIFVVIDNDGGGIFHMLPIRDYQPEFTRFFATPHGLPIDRLAESYGLPVEVADGDGAAIREALERAFAGWRTDQRSRMVVVRSDRRGNLERRGEVTDRLVEAVERALQ